jgi:hypothetical protein
MLPSAASSGGRVVCRRAFALVAGVVRVAIRSLVASASAHKREERGAFLRAGEGESQGACVSLVSLSCLSYTSVCVGVSSLRVVRVC